MFLYDPHETLPILNYVNKLTKEILVDGDWFISENMIDVEIDMKKQYKSSIDRDPILNYTWGADLQNDKQLNEEEIVLSVSIGGTYDIVEKYAIHAHPNDYNYKTPTKYIMF
ncbi:hypothetical protein AM233_19895 [Bacillus sp. FJAT-22058]|nr:hypothetical protein AM233_19895 [Bacillus sp. FJAT-22058]